MEKRSLREKQLHSLAKNVIGFKDTLKKWYSHIGIKFLQEHQLTDEQEEVLEDFTDYIDEAIDKLEEDESPVRATKLPPIELPKKKNKTIL